VIEVDGGQHDTASAADEARTKVLEAKGYRVSRSWNNDVLTNRDGVLEDILSKITATPTPNPSPQGQGYRIWKSCAHTSPCGMDRIGEATQSFRIGFGFVLGSIRWPCVDSAKACPRSGRIQQGQSHMR